jgi:predicted nucleic acid-binding protein
VIYLDSSAIFKLVVPEPESAALFTFLDAQDTVLASSELATVEVHRALLRTNRPEGHELHDIADTVLEHLERLPLASVIRSAALLPGDLRSLEALHLASALRLPSLSALVTYDRRLAEHAVVAGLPVESPDGT